MIDGASNGGPRSEPHPGGNEGSDEMELDHSPILHELRGATHAENEAHMIARITLMNLLHADPDVNDRFQAWAEEAGLGHLARRAAELLEEVAVRFYGLEGRGHFFNDDGHDYDGPDSVTLTVETDAEATRLLALPDDALTALNDFFARFSKRGWSDHTMRAALHLVRDEWGLPWPWLTVELFELFIYRLAGSVQGLTYRKNYWYVPGPGPLDQPMPETVLKLEWTLGCDGETVGEALERAIESICIQVGELFAGMIDDAECSWIPCGRFTSLEQIERDVTWWYRNHIRGESIRSLALEHNPYGDARKTVRDAINRAYHWLDSTNWAFDRKVA